MNKNKKFLFSGLCMLFAFVLWTILLLFVDVRAIGPQQSLVGFSTLNGFIHRLTGFNMTLYTVTDWFGLIPFAFVIGFGIFGLIQWLKRKSLKKVDLDILALGGFYVVVMLVYLLFEVVVVNYRPLLINGYLEVSYPSSTTMLVMCVMPTAIMQFNDRIKNRALKHCISAALAAFVAFMVIGRLVSGVHWFSDIIGGAMLSLGLVLLYRFVSNKK